MSYAGDVAQLAAGQWGLLTTAQAEREGITRQQLARLAKAGVLERLSHGVYAVTAAADDERLHLRAAWLSLDPDRTPEERLADPSGDAVVSHASAASLHRLGDLLDDVAQFTVNRRLQTRRSGVSIHRGEVAPDDVTIVDGLPVTSEERTIADLMRAGTDTEHVAQMVGQGLRRGVIERSELAEHLAPLARHHGERSGADLVAHLLDVAGLSPDAVMRDLAATPLGERLFEVGRLTAFQGVLDAISPKSEFEKALSTLAILDTLKPAAGMLESLEKTFAVMPRHALPELPKLPALAHYDSILKMMRTVDTSPHTRAITHAEPTDTSVDD